jgi:hypothetical protein
MTPHNMSFKEMSEQLGIPVKRVEKIYWSAIRKLRKYFYLHPEEAEELWKLSLALREDSEYTVINDVDVDVCLSRAERTDVSLARNTSREKSE